MDPLKFICCVSMVLIGMFFTTTTARGFPVLNSGIMRFQTAGGRGDNKMKMFELMRGFRLEKDDELRRSYGRLTLTALRRALLSPPPPQGAVNKASNYHVPPGIASPTSL